MRRPARQDASHQKGTAAIEFALIAPVFFLIFFVALAFALAFYVQATLQGAAWNGVEAVLQIDRSQCDLSQGAGGACASGGSYASRATQLATQAVQAALTAAPQIVQDNANVNVELKQNAVVTTVTFDYASHPALPTFGIPIGTITGQARASFW